jgi:hypothetical protein
MYLHSLEGNDDQNYPDTNIYYSNEIVRWLKFPDFHINVNMNRKMEVV